MEGSTSSKPGEADEAIIPREYLIKIIAQCLNESSITISDLEKEIENQALLQTRDASQNNNNSNLVEDIRAGRWDTALEPLLNTVKDYSLACDALELIVKSLVSVGATEAARLILTQIPLMSILLPKKDPARFTYLQKCVNGSIRPFSENGDDEERERLALASRIESSLFEQGKRKGESGDDNMQASLEPNRLLSFIRDGLKWRRLAGEKRFEWDSSDDSKKEERHSKRHQTSSSSSSAAFTSGEKSTTLHHKPKAVNAKFGKGVRLQCCCTSSDGETIAVGTSDGFVELLHASTLKTRKDLAYQAADEPIFLDVLVTCVSFSISGKLIACGDITGSVHVLNVETGSKARVIATGHANGVSCVAFSPDETRIATGGVDAVCRIFGMASGSKLCECIGHESFVNSIAYVSPTRILTGSSDEKCCLWNANTGEQVRVFTGFHGKVIRACPLALDARESGPACFYRYGEMTHALICSSSQVSLIKLDGSSTVSILIKRSSPDIVDCVVSRSGALAFCLTNESKLFQLDIQKKSQVTSAEKIGLGSKVEAQSPVCLSQSPSHEVELCAMWSNGLALFTEG